MFTQLLEHYFDVICTKSRIGTDLEAEQIKSLFEIIFKLVQRSMNISESFLALGIFRHFLKLFDEETAVRFVFTRYLLILHKIARIFYNLSKQVYYSDSEHSNNYISSTLDVETLKKMCRLFKELTNNLDVGDDNALLRLYLITMSHLQVKFFKRAI